MADWAQPTLASNFTDVLSILKARDDDASRLFSTGTFSNIPTDAIGLRNKRFERWDGGAWVEHIPKASDKWDINVDRVDGFDAGNLTGNIPVSNGTVNANLNADFLDGQHGSFYQNAGNLNAGTILAARMPALTGDVTTSAGAVATTLVAASVLSKLLTVDGAGSLLDADLVDGSQPGTIFTQNANNVTITGGTINGTVIGGTTPAAGTFTTIVAGTSILPDANDGAVLGSATVSWSDLFLASGAVIGFANGNSVITHSSGILTVSTGDLRVTTAGANTASVVTVGGAQTLTGKTLTSPTIGTSPTAAGATWANLGAVTTVDINGGSIDGTPIGVASPSTGSFTTLLVGATTNQGAAYIAARRGGNSIEFGHTNTAGYGSTLGSEVGSGSPFVGFNCEAGTTSNTYRTRGNVGHVVRSNNAGDLVFSTIATASADNQSPTEIVRISAAGGIQFPATQIVSANANTLDDYEEGTFTPTASSSAGTITAYTSSARYTKIGDVVLTNMVFAVSNNGTGAGIFSFAGLPFTGGASTYVGVGRNYTTTGSILQSAGGNSTSGFIVDYANAYPVGTGHSIAVNHNYFT